MKSSQLCSFVCLISLLSLSHAGGRRSKSRRNFVAVNETAEDTFRGGNTRGRKGKLFSLFNVVQFKNEPCQSSASLSSGSVNRNGTCFTATQCADKGGSTQGNCAAGFGVCCIFTLRGTNGDNVVTQNCSYIQNPDFPSVTSDATGISYTVNRCNEDVCQLRLDFEVFGIAGTTLAATDATTDGLCQDTMTITGQANHQIPTICGENAGQHIYVDAADPTTITFQFDGTVTNRQWDIKITQLECSNANRAPNGCFQYHTTLTGRITTFNFSPANENHLINQQYSVCVRPESGFCCVQYTVCQDEGDNAFSLSTLADATQDDDCLTEDYVGISGSGASCNQGSNLAVDNRYCGQNLNVNGLALSIPICDCTAPFIVDIFTNDLAEANVIAQSRGVCLDYTQIPCE